MRLIFKQRLFAWFDSYDIYYEGGQVAYTVKGQLAWGHCLKIYDAAGTEVGMVKEKVFTFLPQFELYLGARYMGMVKKEFSFFMPKFTVEYGGWTVDGNFMEWDYTIRDAQSREIASVAKEIFNLTDTYVMDISDPRNALSVLMLVLAIDAEKCSRNN